MNIFSLSKRIKQQKILFDKILKNLTMLKDKKLINHNLDVKTLYFKFI
jgi:hypothetical protein